MTDEQRLEKAARREIRKIRKPIKPSDLVITSTRIGETNTWIVLVSSKENLWTARYGAVVTSSEIFMALEHFAG